jgi:hypothetical protein
MSFFSFIMWLFLMKQFTFSSGSCLYIMTIVFPSSASATVALYCCSLCLICFVMHYCCLCSLFVAFCFDVICCIFLVNSFVKQSFTRLRNNRTNVNSSLLGNSQRANGLAR